MQMVIQSLMIYQIRLRSVLGKGSHLFGTRTCTNSSRLTGVKWRDFGTYAESGPTQFDDFRNYF